MTVIVKSGHWEVTLYLSSRWQLTTVFIKQAILPSFHSSNSSLPQYLPSELSQLQIPNWWDWRAWLWPRTFLIDDSSPPIHVATVTPGYVLYSTTVYTNGQCHTSTCICTCTQAHTLICCLKYRVICNLGQKIYNSIQFYTRFFLV